MPRSTPTDCTASHVPEDTFWTFPPEDVRPGSPHPALRSPVPLINFSDSSRLFAIYKNPFIVLITSKHDIIRHIHTGTSPIPRRSSGTYAIAIPFFEISSGFKPQNPFFHNSSGPSCSTEYNTDPPIDGYSPAIASHNSF